MICYNHNEIQAVAVCKNCFKAICKECTISDDNGFACSEKCHEEIVVYQSMIEKSKTMYGVKPGRAPVMTILLLVAGFPFLCFGAFSLVNGDWIGLFTLVMGIIFLVIGTISYINMKKTGIRS